MVECTTQKVLQKFTWEEVKKHNTRADCWIVLERVVDGEKKGLVLDVTDWARRHPGGSIIYDGIGGDCTVMFWTYHPLSFVDNSSSYVDKLVIGEVEGYRCMFNIDSKFFRTVKERVEAKVPRAERRYDVRMYIKSLLLIAITALFYRIGWMTGSIPGVILYSFFWALIALNLMHDGIHHSYSTSPFMCFLAAYSFNLAGANYLSYRRAHAFGHHVYTNHDEYDSSHLRPYPSLKLHAALPAKWFHKIQHIYGALVYMFGAIAFWVSDQKEVRSLYNYPLRPGPMTWRQYAVMATGKLFFIYWYLVQPFLWFDKQAALIQIFVFWAAAGSSTAIWFAVNHWTDKAIYVTDKELLNTTTDWATMQVLSSCNYDVDSFFWGHISGSLNLQVEHHLFPAMVHTRLRTIMPIVRATCMEFGLDYDAQCFPTFWAAVASNFSYIKRVGTQVFTQPPSFKQLEFKIKHA